MSYILLNSLKTPFRALYHYVCLSPLPQAAVSKTGKLSACTLSYQNACSPVRFNTPYNYSRTARHGTNACNRWNCNTSGTFQTIPKNMILGIVTYTYTSFMYICANNRSHTQDQDTLKVLKNQWLYGFCCECEWFNRLKSPKTANNRAITAAKSDFKA